MVKEENTNAQIHKLWLNAKCECGLTPEHVHGEHDWCCEICGNHHVERICPNRKDKI
jgi:hypothetical protein